VTGVYPHEVQAIDINPGERVMKVTKTNGENAAFRTGGLSGGENLWN